MINHKMHQSKNMDEINCENKYSCFFIRGHTTLCPECDRDIDNIGVYSPPTPKEVQEKHSIDDFFYLNKSIETNSSSEDKSINIAIEKGSNVWKISLIQGYVEHKKLDGLYSNAKKSNLLKICKGTKLALTRRKSALRICKSVLAHQEKFFQEGLAFIVPMSVLDVALDVSLDESCVSRYTHKIILHTPHGTVKLRYLFNSQGYMGNANASYSKIAIQMKMKNIVEHEAKNKKLSDSGISGLLKKDGIDISRRAVTKYRLEMGIPSSRARKHSCAG